MAELSLQRVSYRYPRATRDALQGVECRFRAGEVTAVVGPSGSGKNNAPEHYGRPGSPHQR